MFSTSFLVGVVVVVVIVVVVFVVVVVSVIVEWLVKEPNKFQIYETEKITCKASDAAEYIDLFSSSTRDRHARRI